jgi:hypothetical protein
MGAKHYEPFQLSFNGSLRVDFQGSWVTSDGGLILVRELDERLGSSELIAQHFTDPRRGKNTQRPVADLLRQSVYGCLAGDEDVNDAERVSQDPTVCLIGSEKIWARGTAPTSRWQSFETERLTPDENVTGPAQINRALIAMAAALVSGGTGGRNEPSWERLGARRTENFVGMPRGEANWCVLIRSQKTKMVIPVYTTAQPLLTHRRRAREKS